MAVEAARAAAACWSELREAEAAAAKIDQEVREAEERQAVKKAQREEDRREERREAAAEIRRARREQARRHREWAHKPTVTLRIAQVMSARTLRNAGYPYGWVRCKGGRIDRTHWECHINAFYQGLEAGMRVWGAGYRNGKALYGTRSSRLRNPSLGYY